MSLISLFAAGLLVVASSTACSDDDDKGKNYLLDVPETDPIEFPGTGYELKTLSVSTTSPEGFTVTPSRENWLTIEQTSNYVTIIPAADNETGSDIEGTITISVKDGPSETIKVSQKRIVNFEYSWNLVWSDEFDGPGLDLDTWNIQTGGTGWGNNELQYYTDREENVRIEDGHLIIEARKETGFGNRQYTSARINTLGKKEFAYGRIEASICFPGGGGTWGAFWMMGGNYNTVGWPLCGEIDIIEQVGNSPRKLINAIHTSQGNGNNGGHYHSESFFDNVVNEFHTYAIEWIEDYRNGFDIIQFYFDDHLTGTKWQQQEGPIAWPFTQPNFILLNMAIGGNLGGNVDDAIFNNDVLMKVDYVRVYERVATEKD